MAAVANDFPADEVFTDFLYHIWLSAFWERLRFSRHGLTMRKHFFRPPDKADLLADSDEVTAMQFDAILGRFTLHLHRGQTLDAKTICICEGRREFGLCVRINVLSGSHRSCSGSGDIIMAN